MNKILLLIFIATAVIGAERIACKTWEEASAIVEAGDTAFLSEDSIYIGKNRHSIYSHNDTLTWDDSVTVKEIKWIIKDCYFDTVSHTIPFILDNTYEK